VRVINNRVETAKSVSTGNGPHQIKVAKVGTDDERTASRLSSLTKYRKSRELNLAQQCVVNPTRELVMGGLPEG
jgi:hypothetical protein